MKKGTIVYIGGFELPNKNAAAHRVLGIGKIFEVLGYNTIYYGVHKCGNTPMYKCNNYFSIKSPESKIEWIKYLFNAKKYIEFLRKKSDIKMVILYNFPAFLSMKILNYCKKSGIKCISDITEWYRSKTGNIIFDIIKNADSEIRMRLVSKKMDGLILVSSFLHKYYSEGKSNILLPPLVDSRDKKYKAIKHETSRKYIDLIYNGIPGKKDKIDFIIDILTNFNNKYHLDVVGISEEQFLKTYNLSGKKIILNNICFYGKVDHEKSLELLKNSDALIFYRDNNIVSNAGFSTKYVEATTCKIPVITNLTSDLSKYIKDGQNAIILESSKEKNINKLQNLSKSDLQQLKKKINVYTFDYRNYIDATNIWINKILNIRR